VIVVVLLAVIVFFVRSHWQNRVRKAEA